jgi:hypothetical protein
MPPIRTVTILVIKRFLLAAETMFCCDVGLFVGDTL